ncbi:MAG: deoxyribodipyrimidine photolyase [Planctomycetota bacterium]|jgi:deoxyribodipyrimidine photo-lyase
MDTTARIRCCNQAPLVEGGKHVLYWMTAARRPAWNLALQRALRHAERLSRPLVVLEALRCDAPYASDRLHRFVLDGMAHNARAFEDAPVLYHPYVEPEVGAGRGLLERLARDACVVVTDDSPAFFLPRMLAAASRRLEVRLEAVDGNGLMPLRATERVFLRAVDFRRHLQRTLRPHLDTQPDADPFGGRTIPPPGALPAAVLRRWPAADLARLTSDGALAHLPIDHAVGVVDVPGGAGAADRMLSTFVGERLDRYADDRNQPQEQVTSGLSPYLHFGHVSPHQVLAALAEREDWAPDRLRADGRGQRTGWWRMSPESEAFLDQLVTWRELGFNWSTLRDDAGRYEGVPDWARRTLEEHAADPREHVYTREEFDAAATHDPLWNAAQTQLRVDGTIHGYLRMLWGKKILEWSRHPRDAFRTMLALNDRYALDGRDPNSTSGIGWCLGRYDRPWGPEREIFGTVRYMSSENTARKLRVRDYVRRWSVSGSGDAGSERTSESSSRSSDAE